LFLQPKGLVQPIGHKYGQQTATLYQVTLGLVE
jgi:hypothetical protein